MAHLTQTNTDRSPETFLLGPYVHETPFTILGRPEAVALLNLDQGWLLRPQPGQQLEVEFSKPAAIATIINNAREQFHSKHAFMFRYHDARTNGAQKTWTHRP